MEDDNDPGRYSVWKSIKMVLIVTSLAVITIVVVSYAGKIRELNPDATACPGFCRDSCEVGEIHLADRECSDRSIKCCGLPAKDPECDGKDAGFECRPFMACSNEGICISKCDYCASNPEAAGCVINAAIGRRVSNFDASFKCSCTDNDCSVFEANFLGTCVRGMCPNNVCCTK